MSVPAIRRSTIESSDSREEELQELADISFHRVWWKRRWVLWLDEPFTFEAQRPWSHRSLPRQALIALLSATAALWALTITLGLLGLLIAAITTSAAAIALGAAIAKAEIRFWAWWTQNDARGVLDAFRRPERLHLAVTTSEGALQALSDAGDPAALAEDFALEHARGLAGWRSYGTIGWVRLSEIADIEPLLELHSATARWRELNESWTDEAEWEATFSGTTPPLPPKFRRRRFLERFRGNGENPVEETSARLRAAARTTRRALEKAASSGVAKTRAIQATATTEPRTRSVIPMIVIAPLLATAAVFGVTIASTPGLAEQLLPDAPVAVPDERPQEAPQDTAADPTAGSEESTDGGWLDDWLSGSEPEESSGETPRQGDSTDTGDILPASSAPDTFTFLFERVFAVLVPFLAVTLMLFAGMWVVRINRYDY